MSEKLEVPTAHRPEPHLPKGRPGHSPLTPCQDEKLTRFASKGIVLNGHRTKFAIAGEDFEITSDTWIIGEIGIGAVADVRGVVRPGVGRFATKIVVVRSV